MALYAAGGKDRRLHVAWGAVGPSGRRSFLTLEPWGLCTVKVRDLQDPTQGAEYRLDFSAEIVGEIWKAVRAARIRDRTIGTEVLNGDFIEIAVERAGETTVTLLRNAYHRPTLVFVRTLNGYLPGEVQVTYSLLDPLVLATRASDD
jgi:hypothetical protein